MTAAVDSSPPRAIWHQHGDSCTLELTGNWHREGPALEVTGATPNQCPDHYQMDAHACFDSTLPAFLLAHIRAVTDATPDKPPSPAFDGLPVNLRALLELALAVSEESEPQTPSDSSSEIYKLGNLTLVVWTNGKALVKFTGETMLSLGRLVTGRAIFRRKDFWLTLQECGVQALPIVSLISFLIGVILAFVGNVQLANFGANLFVADLVGIAMVREMGVMMTAIIMSGRTGAAFAAHLGSMKANEEIDALRTFGFNPFDFLVLPRLLSLLVMMPLLTIYANFAGILGGMLVGYFVGIPPVLYWTETLAAVTLTASSLGVIKSVFFGAIIAIGSCRQGMQAGNSTAAVGQATTRAVVTAITSVIVLDSAFAAIFTLLHI